MIAAFETTVEAIGLEVVEIRASAPLRLLIRYGFIPAHCGLGAAGEIQQFAGSIARCIWLLDTAPDLQRGPDAANSPQLKNWDQSR